MEKNGGGLVLRYETIFICRTIIATEEQKPESEVDKFMLSLRVRKVEVEIDYLFITINLLLWMVSLISFSG